MAPTPSTPAGQHSAAERAHARRVDHAGAVCATSTTSRRRHGEPGWANPVEHEHHVGAGFAGAGEVATGRQAAARTVPRTGGAPPVGGHGGAGQKTTARAALTPGPDRRARGRRAVSLEEPRRARTSARTTGTPEVGAGEVGDEAAARPVARRRATIASRSARRSPGGRVVGKGARARHSASPMRRRRSAARLGALLNPS